MSDAAYDIRRSSTPKQRAEAQAVQRAFEDYARSPAAQEITMLVQRVQTLENFISNLRGEEGIDNEGPIFRLSRRPIPIAPEAFTGVTLTFCDEDDVQHTGDFHVKNIVPPL